MLGRLLGKVVAAPLRIANIPLKVADKITGLDEDGDTFAWPLEQVAEAIEETGEEIDR